MLYKKSNFRIRKIENKGFLVEQKQFKWSLFGIGSYWTHFISYNGLPSEPFYYDTFDRALEDFKKELSYELIRNHYVTN
jgi:hypothetical protein